MNLKNLLCEGDRITFINGNKAEITTGTINIIKAYFDDNLRCNKNHIFDIVKIERPYYKTVYDSENGKIKIKKK